LPSSSHRSNCPPSLIITCAASGLFSAGFVPSLSFIAIGNAAEKTRRLYQSQVDAINSLEPAMESLSDEQLRAKTKEFQNRYKDGERLDDLLVEAFAVG
jgi:hypothetical protein